MNRLPRTEMHHGLAVAWFAFSCLLESICHPHRKARP